MMKDVNDKTISEENKVQNALEDMANTREKSITRGHYYVQFTVFV